MQEKVIWTRLQTFCEQLSTAEQATFSLPMSSTTIDVGGSFLPPGDDLDFFDTNAQGEIVLEPPHAMFPEDFPPGGPTEHKLSWWGVLDYDAGKGKFAHPPPEQQQQQQPQGYYEYAGAAAAGGHYYGAYR